jgi:secreted trypsin-like serine protease
MKRIRRGTLMLLVLAMLATAAPVGAITNGTLDGDRHPQVVLVLMEVDDEPMFRCTGTLIAPTYVLTAGHCADNAQFSGIRIFTESDVDGGDNDYPFGTGNNTIEAIRFSAHPEYDDALFFLHDVGMIELAEPVMLDPEDYATLPSVDSLDALANKRGKQDVTFTSVGYGLQAAQLNNPTPQAHTVGVRVRMFSTPKLDQINAPGFTGDYSMLLSNNTKTGGTCFGDSGGPNFLGSSNVVAAVTSFGLNSNCGGTGGVFRVDRQNVLDFINEFMAVAD